MNNFDIELIKRFVSKDRQESALAKLKKGYPVQYIIGNVEFCDCIINVNESVLIPRFETEYLVNDLVDYIKSRCFNNARILDIGTGSGCISIALKKQVNMKIDAFDISKSALEVAKYNAKNNNVDINFINGDIKDYVFSEKYDILVSNPPYVPFGSSIDEKIRFEPRNAIFAEEEGLYFYRIILEKSKSFMNKKNIIAFEIGDKQSQKIVEMAKRIYPDAQIVTKKDLNNYDRYIYIFND